MRRFARYGWQVLFIEGIAMRSVVVGERSELRRVVKKLRAPVGTRTVEERLHVLRPVPIPPAGQLGRRAQLAILRHQIERARRRLGLAGPTIAWFSLPNAAPLLGRLGERSSILYYQDRYEAFSHVDSEHLRACLAQLATGCDATIASAGELADDLSALGAHPAVVPHGVDLESFTLDGTSPPQDLSGLERPLIGHVGLIDDYISFPHLLSVADALERGTLVLVGGANVDTGPLEAHPRVALLGPRPYAEIPAYLHACACCLVPFTINRLTVGVNPIKLREYLAAGRPTVATPMPEILGYGDVVSIADSPEAYAQAVLAAAAPENDTPERRRQRRSRVAPESWDVVAARIEPLLAGLLNGEA
jgi:hypothetical protein